jgi:hypothetical protein
MTLSVPDNQDSNFENQRRQATHGGAFAAFQMAASSVFVIAIAF